MRSLHFGSAMVDTIALVATEDIERLTLSNEGVSFLMVETGRKLPAESITTHIGGGACNTAVSLCRRGWQSSVLARVGRDLNAAAVREHLEQCGVEDRLIPSDQATGTAVMVASHDRNASIFVHRGANERLAIADLPAFDGVDLVYIASLSSGSADCFPEIVRRAKAAGARIAANPGIRQLGSREDDFFAALPGIDLISFNRPEADALVPALAREAANVAPFVPPPDPPPLIRRGPSLPGLRDGACHLRAGPPIAWTEMGIDHRRKRRGIPVRVGGALLAAECADRSCRNSRRRRCLLLHDRRVSPRRDGSRGGSARCCPECIVCRQRRGHHGGLARRRRDGTPARVLHRGPRAENGLGRPDYHLPPWRTGREAAARLLRGRPPSDRLPGSLRTVAVRRSMKCTCDACR